MCKEEQDLIREALEFAEKAHDGTCRKGTKTPYVTHVLEAATIAAGMTDDPVVISAALLHDTLEDTPVTAEELEEKFGSEVTAVVGHESEDKREDIPESESWKIRKEEALADLRGTDDIRVKIVALSDKLSNVRALYRDYCELGDRMWDKFHEKDPNEQRWYYESYLEICEDLKNTVPYMEYAYLLGKLFQNK